MSLCPVVLCPYLHRSESEIRGITLRRAGHARLARQEWEEFEELRPEQMLNLRCEIPPEKKEALGSLDPGIIC